MWIKLGGGLKCDRNVTSRYIVSKIVMRQTPVGSFFMGSEVQHSSNLTGDSN